MRPQFAIVLAILAMSGCAPVVGEIALSCALLVGAGLMTKSIVQLRNYDFAFATTDVFTARVGLFENDYPDRESRARFFESLRQRLESVPGARSVALTNSLPALGSGWQKRGLWRCEARGRNRTGARNSA